MRWACTSPAELAGAREALAGLVTACLEEALEVMAAADRDQRQEDLLGFIEQAAEAARSLRRLSP